MAVTVWPARKNLQSFPALWRFEQGQPHAQPESCASIGAFAAVHEFACDAVDGCAGRPAEGRRCESVTVKA